MTDAKKTAIETEAAFRAELQALLDKYKATISIEDLPRGCSSFDPYDTVINDYIEAEFDYEECVCTREIVDFDLGSRVDFVKG